MASNGWVLSHALSTARHVSVAAQGHACVPRFQSFEEDQNAPM
jgi:hypothetical protein